MVGESSAIDPCLEAKWDRNGHMLTDKERRSLLMDKYYELILPLIKEKGELGVNEIARGIGVPVSTVQKYLERQMYFKKTQSRKWDIPENVNADIKSNTLTLMVESVENTLRVLEAQLGDIQQTVGTVSIPLNTLRRGIETLSQPVAGKSVDIHPRLIDLDKKAKEALSVIGKFVPKVPEEYRDLLKHLDLHSLMIEMGTIYTNDILNVAISSLFLEKEDTLPNDIIDVLKNYQKGE
jgi:hypothetical protein